MPTLEDYRFDLRDGLKMAAKAGLAQLEEMISEVGYGWLEGYMEGIMEREFSKWVPYQLTSRHMPILHGSTSRLGFLNMKSAANMLTLARAEAQSRN